LDERRGEEIDIHKEVLVKSVTSGRECKGGERTGKWVVRRRRKGLLIGQYKYRVLEGVRRKKS